MDDEDAKKVGLRHFPPTEGRHREGGEGVTQIRGAEVDHVLFGYPRANAERER